MPKLSLPLYLHKSSRSGQIILALLCAAILVGLGLRFALSAEKMVLEYDDSISLLVATGHEGEYAEIAFATSSPLMQWVPAAEWKRMLAPEPGRGLHTVTHDLAVYDIHPPLYFWLLALWVRLAGTSLLALHLLNLVLDVLVGLTLFWIGRREWGSLQAGLLLAGVWALSPAAIKATPWVRQYILLSLAVILFAYLLYRLLEQPRTAGWQWRGLALMGVALGGMLTHYYFALIILVGLILTAFRLRLHRAARPSGLALTLSLGLAAAAFLALNPGISSSVATYAAYKLEPLARMDLLGARLGTVAKTNLLLFSPAILGLGLAWLSASLSTDRIRGPHPGLRHGLRHLRQDLRRHPLAGWMLAFTLLAAATIIILFLVGIGPRHAMSSRYIGYLTPLAALIPVPLLLSSPRRGALLLFLAGMFLSAGATMHPDLAQAQEGSFDRASLRAAPAVVIDSVEWGTWPMVVHHLQDEQLVYVAHSSNLAYDPSAWIDTLAQGGIYVSILRGEENTAAGRTAVLAVLEERYTVERLSRVKRPGDWEITLYAIRP